MVSDALKGATQHPLEQLILPQALNLQAFHPEATLHPKHPLKAPSFSIPEDIEGGSPGRARALRGRKADVSCKLNRIWVFPNIRGPDLYPK